MAKEIRLPDIGDFKDVPIIEVQIAPGKSVRKEETILTLESDKATMDVPAPEDGVIGEIHVKVGDKVSEGALLATYAEGGKRPPPRLTAAPRSKSQRPRPRPRPLRSPRPIPAARRMSRRTSSSSAPVPAATRPPSAPPIWARMWCLSTNAHDARRRLPQCRLHPIEGAPACREDDRRSGRDGRAWGEVRQADLHNSSPSATGSPASSNA